ncbi:hypothetical protein GCM10011405_30610 [Rufibacter glacialis]|nr:hypothetical protein GCM10011405_30610 [Rufibacter glacialis]
MHKGKAKGKAVGKARGKAKGITYIKRLEALKVSHPESWMSHGWLPINVTTQDIEAAAAKHWKDTETKFEIDRALSLSSLLIILRCKVSKEQKRRAAYSAGFANLHSHDLILYVGNHYRKYLQLFIDARFISVHPKGLEDTRESFCPNAFAKAYKWQPRHMRKEGDQRMFQRVEYGSPRLLLRLFKKKQDRKQQLLKDQFRSRLKEDAFRLAAGLEADGFTAWALANPQEFPSQEELNKAIVQVHAMKAGELGITPTDAYGERFHSSYTQTKRELRQFQRIGYEQATELDLKASQFFFFACMVHYPEQCTEVLRRGMSPLRLREVMHTMRASYEKYADVREFVDASLGNNIYATIMGRYGGSLGKAAVKDLCFRALFSSSGQSPEEKKVLCERYPNVIKLCENINNWAKKQEKRNRLGGNPDAPIYSIPQLLQRLESRILIDMVALRAADHTDKPFTTIHDSFLIAPSDAPLFRAVIEDTFRGLGLPVPRVEQK